MLNEAKGLAEKEFSIIQELAKKPAQTQRELSRSTGLSLGMTNIILNRLARKGYVKITHLDWKRMQYLLTVEGVMEKTRKSYAYALHAIRQFQVIRKRIHEVVQVEYKAGMRLAVVVAWPETADMIRQSIEELGLSDLEVTYVAEFNKVVGWKGIVFAATIEPAPEKPDYKVIPLLDEEILTFKFPNGTEENKNG